MDLWNKWATQGGSLGVLQRLTILTNVLLFCVFGLLLTLLAPGRVPYAFLAVLGGAAVLAALIAPYLLRLMERMHRRVTQQNNELRSLRAIDNAILAEPTLDAILEVAVRQITLAVDGELGALWLCGEEDESSPAAQALYNISPYQQTVLREEDFTTHVLRQMNEAGAPQRRRDLETTWGTDRVAAALKLRNTIAVPIQWQETLRGVFLVGNRGNTLTPLEGFTAEDEALLVATAATAAVAVQNARLRREARRRDEMLRALVARTGEAVTVSSDVPRLMQTLAQEAASIIGYPRVAVYGYDEAQNRFLPLAVHDETPQGAQTRAAFSEEPLSVEAAISLPDAREKPYVPDVRAALGLPAQSGTFLARPGFVFVLRSRERQPIGLFCLLEDAPHAPSAETAAFARALAAQTAVALENARLFAALQAAYDQEKHIAQTLQESLLPPIPERCGLFEFTHKYQAALDGAIIGGDFLDFFPLDGHAVGVVMADVSGKGLKAAVQTAMIKYTLRGFAYEVPQSPACVLARVNDVLCSDMTNHDGFVTLFYGVLNTLTGELTYANAGHEPPLLREAQGGAVRALDAGGGLALGCLPAIAYKDQSLSLSPDDLLLLYTDGLTEARNAEQQFLGVEGLTGFLPPPGTPARVAVETIFERVCAFAGEALGDDAAMLALRYRPATLPAPLQLASK